MNSFALHKTNFQQVWHSPNVNLWHSANRWEPKFVVTRKKFPLLFPAAVAVGAQKTQLKNKQSQKFSEFREFLVFYFSFILSHSFSLTLCPSTNSVTFRTQRVAGSC